MKCWVCGTELIWGGDQDLDDDEGNPFASPPFDGHTIITNLSCPKCEAYVEVYHGNKQKD